MEKWGHTWNPVAVTVKVVWLHRGDPLKILLLRAEDIPGPVYVGIISRYADAFISPSAVVMGRKTRQKIENGEDFMHLDIFDCTPL